MAENHEKEFIRKPSKLQYLYLAVALVSIAAVYSSFTRQQYGFAAMWAVISLVWLFNYYISNTPGFLRITRDSIVNKLNRLRIQTIRFDTVQSITETTPSRVVLQLTSGRNTVVYLNGLDRESRKEAPKIIKKLVEKHQKGKKR